MFDTVFFTAKILDKLTSRDKDNMQSEGHEVSFANIHMCLVLTWAKFMAQRNL